MTAQPSSKSRQNGSPELDKFNPLATHPFTSFSTPPTPYNSPVVTTHPSNPAFSFPGPSSSPQSIPSQPNASTRNTNQPKKSPTSPPPRRTRDAATNPDSHNHNHGIFSGATASYRRYAHASSSSRDSSPERDLAQVLKKKRLGTGYGVLAGQS